MKPGRVIALIIGVIYGIALMAQIINSGNDFSFIVLGLPFTVAILLKETFFAYVIFYFLISFFILFSGLAAVITKRWLIIILLCTLVLNIGSGYLMLNTIKGIAEAAAKAWCEGANRTLVNDTNKTSHINKKDSLMQIK
jgi:hypothetical protein